MTDLKKFKKWVRELRKLFPSSYPVRVMLVHPSKVPDRADGYCHAYGVNHPDHFNIYVANNLSISATADTLAEEWAHCLRFHVWKYDGDAHDSIYAAIFGEIKRGWLDKEPNHLLQVETVST